MQGEEDVIGVFLFQIEGRKCPRVQLLQLDELVEKVIDHDVADKMNTPGVFSFLEKITYSTLFRDEEVIRNGIRNHAVDFFGHCEVEAPEPRFNMGQLRTEFFGDYAA